MNRYLQRREWFIQLAKGGSQDPMLQESLYRRGSVPLPVVVLLVALNFTPSSASLLRCT